MSYAVRCNKKMSNNQFTRIFKEEEQARKCMFDEVSKVYTTLPWDTIMKAYEVTGNNFAYKTDSEYIDLCPHYATVRKNGEEITFSIMPCI